VKLIKHATLLVVLGVAVIVLELALIPARIVHDALGEP
jgi:hypothetical protein